MPSNFLTADTSFPHLTEEQSTDEKFRVMTDYLFMLLEQLRYTLANLGEENFNGASLDALGMRITEPIYVDLKNAAGEMAAVKLTAEGINTRVQSLEGNYTTLTQTVNGFSSQVGTVEGQYTELKQTVNGFSSRVSTVEGNYSTLTQTVNGFSSRVSTVEGNYSTLTQTVNGFSSRVSTVEGNYSTLTQTVNGFSSRVSTVEGNYSTLTQTVNGFSSRVSTVEGQYTELKQTVAGFDFTGVVTISSLENPANTTVINSASITTGTISAVDIEGSVFRSIANVDGTYSGAVDICFFFPNSVGGGLRADVTGEGSEEENKHRIFLYTCQVSNVYPALKLQSCDSISIEAAKSIYENATHEYQLAAQKISLKTKNEYGFYTGSEIMIDGYDIYLTGNVYVNGNLIS